MKYLAAFGIMLLCNEILTLIAIIVAILFFLRDVIKEAH